MEISAILIILMFFAIFLSLVSLTIAMVSMFKTNKKLKNLIQSFKLFVIRSFVEKGMKKDNQYEGFDSFFKESLEEK